MRSPDNMSVEENIEVVRRFGEALTGRDWAAFDELVAEDCEWIDAPSGRTIHGRDELITACKSFTTAFPDFSVESVTLIEQPTASPSEDKRPTSPRSD